MYATMDLRLTGNSRGWVTGIAGTRWFVQQDGKRREGSTRTTQGAKSAMTQVARRMGQIS